MKHFRKNIVALVLCIVCFVTAMGLTACGTTKAVFEYQLIGRVFEQGPASEGVPGEQIVRVEIDTGDIQVDANKVKTTSFSVNKGARPYDVKSVSVVGNKITLTLNDGFDMNGLCATSHSAGANILEMGTTSLDIDKINLYVDEGIDGYDIELNAKTQKYYNPWIDDFSYRSPDFIKELDKETLRNILKEAGMEAFFDTWSKDYNEFKLTYDLYLPDGKGEAKAPLIVWLPSASEIQSDRAPRAHYPVGNLLLPENQAIFGENGCYVMTVNYFGINTITAFAAATEIVECIEKGVKHAIETFTIDTDRIYIMGGSLGGTFTSGVLAWMKSDIFAGAIAAASGFTFEQSGAAVIAERKVPVWFLHAQNDAIGPAGGSVQAKNAVNNAGGKAYATIFSTTKRDGVNEQGHSTWLYILRNFTGEEEEVLASGTAKYNDGDTQKDIAFTSDTPKSLGYDNILSWLAAQKKSNNK